MNYTVEEAVPTTTRRSQRVWLHVAIWTLTLIAILPAIFHWQAHTPAVGVGKTLRSLVLNLIVLGICYLIYRTERRHMSASSALSLVILFFVLTGTVNFMHKYMVDYGGHHFGPLTHDVDWQIFFHNGVINLDPGFLPHTYRFLPNAVVRWMEIAGISFVQARNTYRLYFMLLIFYALYRYARLYTSHIGGIIAALCTAAVFPATFVNYAGQLTDPMLQLAFLLCFIFLETEDFPLFLATMLIGSLAKETILAMAGYYVLFCRHHRNYLLRSVVTCLSAVVVYFGVRLFVLKGSFAYRDVSGVTLQHVSRNWHLFTWVDNTLATCAVFIPFLILGWRKTPRALKQQFFYWLPVIFVSSLFFSWLVEVRNYMPVIFVLSVVTGIFFSQQVESQAPPTLTKS